MEFIDRFNRRILLTEERWKHIAETHPELKEMLKELEETLKNPELIKRSVYSENVLLFYKYYEHIHKGKHICVVINTNVKSIVTAYITDRIKRGEVIWKKN